MKLELDKVASVTMIVASVALVSAAASFQWRGPRGRPTDSPTYTVGEQFVALPGVTLTDAPKTLVMFLRSTCRYCTDSVPFYRRLIDRTSRTPVVAVSFEPEETLRSYLAEHGLRPDRVVSASRGSLRLTATPTLLLVSASGRIEKIWRGLQRTEKEAEILLATGLPLR